MANDECQYVATDFRLLDWRSKMISNRTPSALRVGSET